MTDRVQSMLGFPAPWATIAVAYLLQNTIFLIMALLVLNMRQWDAWPVTAGLVLAFNLYLPRSVARRGIVGLDREALREVLYLSPHPIERLWVARLAAETVSFWIHYGGPELVACLVLVSWPANPLLGVGLAVIFIGVVTAIHLSTLTSRAKPVGSRIQIPFSYWRYLLTLVGLTMLTAVGTDWLIVPIARHPLPFSMLVMDPERTLRAFSNAWREHLLSLRHTCTVWVYGHAGQEEIVGLVGLAAWIVIRLFNAKREARILEAGGTGVGAGLRGIYVFYHAVARAIWPSDPFVRRDLLWLQRNQVFTPLSSPLQLMMPPVVSSALGVVISLFGVTSPAGFVLGCWFIALQSCYQTASLFFWSFPIVYPGSELRQQELIRLSPTESLWRLKRSKARLLGLLGLPLVIELLLIFLVAGFVQRIGAWNLAIGLTGLIAICALAFLVCSLRIFAMNRYDYDDIFAVARENVGLTFIRILEQLPKRLLYIAFLSFLCLTLFFQNAMSNEWISLLALALACVDVGVIAWTWILSGRGTHLGQNAHRSEDPENRRDWRTFRRALLSRWGRLVLALCGIYAFAVAAGAYLEISFVPPIAHNPHLAWQAYFIHNVVSWGMAAGLGLLTLGFGSLVLLAFNGLIAGEAVCLMFQEKHAGWIYTAFLPHAVFEIPAQLLAALVPYLLFASIGTGGRGMESGSQRWVALRWAAALSFGAMALLFLAAWMESIFGI
ncbi:MAG: stage II sporulation protein M [Alicyclobacillus mali]|uniref:stage II sporulation protein M n=1 Tax=Alicyclobacillus mali (ex Roth et al. 2021) TaxID=1123961 RepID=UPI00083742A3|nr:stage II sporulation protein M [Alicyclobacillus mali (ex Roth et al. 2021)]MCL6488569.1 stage II sporulation protein M [Alicyclobacillus mali (ex Roth et al. 2021)]